jgi:hypothetical protein
MEEAATNGTVFNSGVIKLCNCCDFVRTLSVELEVLLSFRLFCMHEHKLILKLACHEWASRLELPYFRKIVS